MNGKFEWTEEYITGYEELDIVHKKLFDMVNELYEMLSDTKQYSEQIGIMIERLKSTMIEHFNIENNVLLKHKLSRYEEHIQAHHSIQKALCEIQNYKVPVVIVALLVSDIIIKYFLEHFPVYDRKFIIELNKQKAD